jgi:hypothetical protein
MSKRQTMIYKVLHRKLKNMVIETVRLTVTKTHPQKISYCYPTWNVCKRRKMWRNVKRICHFTVSVVYQSMICCSSRFIAKGFVSSCDTFIIYFISLFHASCDIRVHHPPLPYQPHISWISELKWSSTMHILEVF